MSRQEAEAESVACLISFMLLCKGVKIPEDRRCQFLWKMGRVARADHAAVPGRPWLAPARHSGEEPGGCQDVEAREANMCVQL